MARFTDIHLADLAFSPAVKGRQGGSNLVVTHAGKPVVFQTPHLALPYSISKWTEPYLKWTMDLSFRDAPRKPAVASFLEWYTALDRRVKEEAVEHSEAWFRRPHTAEEVNGMYCSSLKQNRASLHPSLRLNLGSASGECAVPFFDQSGARNTRNDLGNDLGKPPGRMGVDDVVRDAEVQVQLELVGVWFFNRQFGLKWKVVQAGVRPRTAEPVQSLEEPEELSELSGCAFL